MNLKSFQSKTQDACSQLTEILEAYFEEHPFLTTNGLAQRCLVSEPTLRRIRKGQSKRIPNPTTILNLLTYLFKTEDLGTIITHCEGPLADHLKEKLPAARNSLARKIQYAPNLGEDLNNPVKYIIYSLASHHLGVHSDKVEDLFGPYGIGQLNEMIQQDLLTQEGPVYKSKIKIFTMPTERLTENFKTLSNFVKTEKACEANPKYSPMLSIRSAGVTKEAYAKILKLQRAARDKIAEVLFDEANAGEIPVFALSAIDTLDNKTAEEF